MNKFAKFLVVVLCAVIIAGIGSSLGSMTTVNITLEDGLGLVDKVLSSQQNNIAPTQQQSVVTPVETQPVTQDTTAPQAETTPSPETTQAQKNDNETETKPADTSAMSNDEIASKITEAINSLKSEQNFKATKTEKTVININDCSISAATDLLNNICQKVAGEKVTTYDFSGGQAVGIGDDGKEKNDGNPVSPKEAIPPKKEDFKLSAAGIKDAKVSKSGDSTTYTVTLVSETSTIDKAPQFNEESVGFLNLGGFEIPTVTITQADINYPETIITVTVNGSGKVTNFKYEQPMDGTMAMKMAIISGSADFDGGNYETWEFTY